MVQLPRTFSFEQLTASHDQPKWAKSHVCSARRHCKWSTIHVEKAKNSGRKCRCDWQMLLQKWTLYLGKPWSCLLCKYKAVNWIETSPEKQERKNRLSWGNSPFSKHRGLLLDMPKLPSLTFSSLAIGLEICLETRQEGGQSMNGLRERRGGKFAVLISFQTHFFERWREGERKSKQKGDFHLGNFEGPRYSGKHSCRCSSFTCWERILFSMSQIMHVGHWSQTLEQHSATCSIIAGAETYSPSLTPRVEPLCLRKAQDCEVWCLRHCFARFYQGR